MKKYSLLLSCLIVWQCCPLLLAAQNINGFKITVGKDASAFLIFNDDVKSFEFNATDGYKYYDIIRRNGNAISIAYKRESGAEPTLQTAIVSEGKRSHSFQIVFDPKYDINKSPQLLFDYSDLKALKRLIADHASGAAQQNEAKAIARQEEEHKQDAKKLAAQKQEEAMKAAKAQAEQKKHQEEAIAQMQAEQKRLAAEAKKAEAETAKEKEYIAQQRKEAERLAQAEKKKREQEELQKQIEAQKAAEERKKEAKRIAAQQAAEEAKRQEELKQIKDAEEKAAKEKIAQEQAEKARIAREAAQRKEEAKRQEEQAAAAERARIAQQKEKEAEEKRIADATKREAELEQKRIALEKKQQEQETLRQKLLQMEAEKKRAAEERKYAYAGLWERYGSKGVNIYDIPEAQHQINNADFYLTQDTLRNFTVSEKLLADNAAPLINTESKPVKGIKIILENMHFIGGNVYYTINIVNESNDDFLQGATGLYWYNKDNTPYKWLSCSYYTYINRVLIVRPQSSQKIVFVTRLAEIANDEKLLLVMDDRRPGSEKMELIIAGNIYNRELKKTETGKIAPSRATKSVDKKNEKKKHKKEE